MSRRAALGSAVVGMMFGAMVGGVLTSAALLVIRLAGAPSWDGFTASLGVALVSWPFAAIVWGAGLLVVGGPACLALHALGVRSQGAAAAWGAGPTWLGVMSLLALISNQAWNDLAIPVSALPLSPLGAAVGWTTARVARASSGEPR